MHLDAKPANWVLLYELKEAASALLLSFKKRGLELSGAGFKGKIKNAPAFRGEELKVIELDKPSRMNQTKLLSLADHAEGCSLTRAVVEASKEVEEWVNVKDEC